MNHHKESRSNTRRDYKTIRFLPTIKWSENDIQKFPTAKNTLVGHNRQCGLGYLVDELFLKCYETYGPIVYRYDHMEEDDLQIINDSESLYGALQYLTRDSPRFKILSQYSHSRWRKKKNSNSIYRDFPDGILACKAMIDAYDKMGDRKIYISTLIQKTNLPFNGKTIGDLNKYMNDFQTTHYELDQEGCGKTDQERVTALTQHLGVTCRTLCVGQV